MTPALVYGFITVCVSLLIWFTLYRSLVNAEATPLLTALPTKAGEQLDAKIHISTASDYVLYAMFKPDDRREFESRNKKIQCYMDVTITQGDALILQRRIGVLELSLGGRELGYTLVYTDVLRAGDYNLHIDNHQEIKAQGAQEPSLTISINAAVLETRLVLYDLSKYICPVIGLFGVIAIIAGLRDQRRQR